MNEDKIVKDIQEAVAKYLSSENPWRSVLALQEDIRAAVARHAAPPMPSAKVRVKFGSYGFAGPLPVIDGVVDLPKETIEDLASRSLQPEMTRDARRWRHIEWAFTRLGMAGAVPEGISGFSLLILAKNAGDKTIGELIDQGDIK